MTKDLKDKAIKIQGKDYVLVADRIVFFNETFTKGAIKTRLLSQPEADRVVFEARVYPDMDSLPERYFVGHSQAKWGAGFINRDSALENAETSAIGRALAMMGIGVIDSVASADEIAKARVNKHISYDDNITDDFHIIGAAGGEAKQTLSPVCGVCKFKDTEKRTGLRKDKSQWTGYFCPNGHVGFLEHDGNIMWKQSN